MSPNSPLVTIQSGPGPLFTNSDVGKNICVQGAGSPGPLSCTTISEYLNPHTVKLARAAIHFVANATAHWNGKTINDAEILANSPDVLTSAGRLARTVVFGDRYRPHSNPGAPYGVGGDPSIYGHGCLGYERWSGYSSHLRCRPHNQSAAE